MLADAAIFVSKRLLRAGFALICLVWVQFALAACEPSEPPEAAERLALPPL